MSDDLTRLSASELAPLVASRKVSPLDLTRAVLARADRLQLTLNCFITLVADHAMLAARQAEDEIVRGNYRGPLHGIPYAAKDLCDTAGVRTTYGSLVHEKNVPARDAVAIARLRAAGAILIGKTTTPEFGHKALTDAPLFGRTRNAWSGERTSGGSSGGAAVAVASGIGPIGVATDGGGSTRIPAACNGVVGLKQGLGTIPHSQSPDGFGTYTYVTPMTRTVRDTALMLQVMAGAHDSDPWSIGVPVPDHVGAVDAARDLKGKRVMYALRLGNKIVSRDVEAAFGRALGRLRDLGAELVEFTDTPPDLEGVWKVINHTTWRARFDDMIRQHGNRVSPSLVRQVAMATDWSSLDLQQAAFRRTDLFRRVQGWFTHADFLVTPTISRSALPLDQDLFEPITIDGLEVGELRRNWFPYTMAFNITGHPALSLGMGFGEDGLPLSLQIVGRFRDETSVLQAAHLYEKSETWLDRWPDL